MVKLLDKVILTLTKKVNATLYAIQKEVGEDNEFSCFMIAEKENPYRIVDLFIPEQEITSISVKFDEEREKSGLSVYETSFIEYLKNDKYRIVGKIHSHNNMSAFFSSTDEDDIGNYFPFNTTNSLPYIDITWNIKNEFKATVILKINNNSHRQIIRLDANVYLEAFPIDTGLIKLIKEKYPDFDIDEEKLGRIITPKIDVSEEVKKIKKKEYGYDKTQWSKSDKKDDEDYTPKIKIEYSKKKKGLIINVWNDYGGEFEDSLNEMLGEEHIKVNEVFTSKKSAYYRYEIDVDFVDVSKLKKEIEDMFDVFAETYEEEDVTEAYDKINRDLLSYNNGYDYSCES